MILQGLCITKLGVIMDKEKAIYYIEHSFISELLAIEDITDISYNGENFYYVSNKYGRKKSDIHVDHQSVKDFLRQIANLGEKQFSFLNPVLDMSIGKYRINATHQSIGKINDENVVSFSIRIASTKPKINDNSDFFNKEIVQLLKSLIKNRQSIVIGGITGSGKTELQKYLLRNMPSNERVIVIDNVLELDSVRYENQIDLTCWQVDENNSSTQPALLIKNALRNNPDWLIVAEARDKEMVDVLNSAMTGMPLITTVHSYDAESIPNRMARLVLRSEQKMNYEDVLKDIFYHFHFFIYLKKDDSKKVIKRFVSEICFYDNDGNCSYLYKKDKGEDMFFAFPKSLYRYLPELKESSK